MISKTSFFNMGIYKSTLKRYAWGSVLYFVLLFLSTGLSLLLNVGRDFSMMPSDFFEEYPVILHGSYIVMPIVLALCVPTIVALLLFRFIHSKKQAIFVHSLPVSKKAVFISSGSAAITLMFIPIILNGLILILISLCMYGGFFSVADCLVWMGYNLLGVFLMFSCAMISAVLTGNSFAMIAINIAIHSFLLITLSALGIMADVFIYGYTSSNAVLEAIVENNFAVVVYSLTDRYFRSGLSTFEIAEYIFAACVLYVASYFLYKKRRVETAGDVAGFKCLNHIFKYVATFLVTMFGFAVFSSYIGVSTAVFALIVLIISIVAYCASEMVLKKTLNVIYAWKGYLGFAAAFVIVVCFMAFTSFFGYETRVPQADDVEEALVYHYYYHDEEPFSKDEEIINMVIDTHKEFVELSEIPIINRGRTLYMPNETNLHIKYKLKNGESIERVYPVSEGRVAEIMGRFYENEGYKKMSERVFMDDSDVIMILINSDNELKDCEELMAALRKDFLALSYKDLHPNFYRTDSIMYSIMVQHVVENREETNGNEAAIGGFHIDITEKYENTVKWLEDNGYKKRQ